MNYQQDIKVLQEFMQNIYWGNDLSSEKAINNLEEGLAEIKSSNGEHMSNILFITKNGYALTSYHCAYKSKERNIINSKKEILR